jgi:hypothetical protein
LRFGSEVTDTVKDVMDRGAKVWEFFKKNSYDAVTTEAQVTEVKKILGEEPGSPIGSGMTSGTPDKFGNDVPNR